MTDGWELPVVGADALPWLTLAQVRELDRLMAEEHAIPLTRMSENAGRELADLTRRLLGGDVAGAQVSVLVGPGGNGVGGLVAARRLRGAGATVSVHLSRAVNELAREAAAQLRSVAAAGVAVARSADLPHADVVLDALLGYGAAGPPRAAEAELIRATSGERVVALDVPSGLELATGTLHDPHVVAEATLALAAPKTALRWARAARGDLYVADIGVPSALYARLGVHYTTPFSRGTLVRVI